MDAYIAGYIDAWGVVFALIKPLAADPIRDAENWFNRITTMKARFIQTSDDGSSAMGDFYMRRPHRARFDYDDPVDIVLITTEVWLHIDEPSRRTVTSYPISETPLKILFSEKVRLHHEGITTTATSDDGVLSVRLAKPTGHDAGVILLEFTEKPFALRRWTITDSTRTHHPRDIPKYRNGHAPPGKAVRANKLCRPRWGLRAVMRLITWNINSVRCACRSVEIAKGSEA